jgi:hypothetical protein
MGGDNEKTGVNHRADTSSSSSSSNSALAAWNCCYLLGSAAIWLLLLLLRVCIAPRIVPPPSRHVCRTRTEPPARRRPLRGLPDWPAKRPDHGPQAPPHCTPISRCHVPCKQTNKYTDMYGREDCIGEPCAQRGGKGATPPEHPNTFSTCMQGGRRGLYASAFPPGP